MMFVHSNQCYGPDWHIAFKNIISGATTMKLVIAAIVAVIVSGCAGGLNGPQTASVGSSGKSWASDALNPSGGGNE